MEHLHNDEYNLNELNNSIFIHTKIPNFFQNVNSIKEFITDNGNFLEESDRHFGDFQTPENLSDVVCDYLYKMNLNPKIVLEPTFGKGNFIFSSLKKFPKIENIYGVELQQKYISFFKNRLFDYAIQNNTSFNLNINNDSYFNHDFNEDIFKNQDEILIIGNPPWVTNSELGSLDSVNLPKKTNFKNNTGLDALTGKSNFDICESIIFSLLNKFHNHKGTIAMLCKNSVVKSILKMLPKHNLNVSDIKMLTIDAKKEFNASVEASLFVAKLGESNTNNDYICDVYNLYNPKDKLYTFGWVGNQFVSNIEKYKIANKIDSESPLTWRSGIKHDCSKIMELRFEDNLLRNGFKEIVDIDKEMVFPLFKSSDLQSHKNVNATNKFVIVTQKQIGQDTSYIKENYPSTWEYLNKNKQFFDKRKSKIYLNKPSFSIFGIGEYSYQPYKVAISSMYSEPSFRLLTPINNKTVMVDDTCYFLSFDNYKYALITSQLLKHSLVQSLLEAIVFQDDKRKYTKDNLMRIDLLKVATTVKFKEIKKNLTDEVSQKDYNDYIEWLKKQSS